ncbi:hypothetical protein MC885_002302 [Smutsia gigantea]|nr:hypothetical protein MC885_002302 [Smutsia gigantea]
MGAGRAATVTTDERVTPWHGLNTEVAALGPVASPRAGQMAVPYWQAQPMEKLQGQSSEGWTGRRFVLAVFTQEKESYACYPEPPLFDSFADAVASLQWLPKIKPFFLNPKIDDERLHCLGGNVPYALIASQPENLREKQMVWWRRLLM